MTTTLALKNKMDDRLSLKVDYFRASAMKTEPHKHSGYFEIVYLLEGAGAHVIDSVKYEVRPQAIYFIRKEQVHHWDLTETPKGYVILVKKRFVDSLLDWELKQLFGKLSSYNCLWLKQAEILPQLLELLLAETNTGEPYQTQVLEGLLKAFFAKVLQCARPTEKIPPAPGRCFPVFFRAADYKRYREAVCRLLCTAPQHHASKPEQHLPQSSRQAGISFYCRIHTQ